MDSWYCCPVHGNKLLRLTPETIVVNTPIYCRKCKKEHWPMIWHGRIYTEAPAEIKK